MDLLAADRGRTAVEGYRVQGNGNDDVPTCTADLIADVLIWAGREGVDWEDALDRAHRYALSGEPCSRCCEEAPSASVRCLACGADAAESR
ncbi:hypothetical protein [Streptomyces sp. MMBL 11-1]|uniref:hypothetical protein n=1 Tax=Streptomyces sp. MMBL 11-1 TaxID=3026420 RepID=UPI002362B34A|nr:hypothetical protein [Streptomyces sp. MMBL 11-1]